MAKQPYIPLYIGDWEQDTNCLSLEAEAAWLKIIFKMFKDGKSGVYKTSTKSLQNLWKSDTKSVQNILNELKENNICDLELGDCIIFSNRRMIRDSDISKIRTDAVQNRYKKPTKDLHPLEYDNGISDNDIEDLLKHKYSVPGKFDFSKVYEKMMDIYLLKSVGYFREDDKDKNACQIIADKIEKVKGWEAKSSLNGHLEEMLAFWSELVDYIAGDSFLRKMDLAYHSTKGWQRLGQHMHKNDLPIKEKDKKENLTDYERNILEQREKAKNKKPE